jgi:hypothetical protein
LSFDFWRRYGMMLSILEPKHRAGRSNVAFCLARAPGDVRFRTAVKSKVDIERAPIRTIPIMSTRPRQAASFPRTIDNLGTYAQSSRWNHRLDRALMTTRYQTRQDLQAASAEAREQASG